MKKKLPSKIYALWNEGSGQKGDEFLQCDYDAQELVEKGESAEVGVYEFVGLAYVSNRTSTETRRVKRKAKRAAR
jgi:hypothetical protein